jgi:myo-inositol catabolism protein IolC
MCAFDHRGSFEKLFGVEGRAPTDEEHGRISDAKTLIYEGYRQAIDAGADRQAGGILVDATYGPDVARRAKEDGFNLAMPAEKSGQAEFDFEFGEDFGRHIEAFDPTFAKVLVRYNPGGDPELNRRQAARLRELSTWLHDRDRRLLFELLVPATQAQLDDANGDTATYDREIRPDLVVAAIAELQAAGVEPDIWKIEGLDRRIDCDRVSRQARSGGRDGVACIVLGRGADEARVIRWLEQGAGVPGYIGFAVGRTLWWDELAAYVAGELDRPAAVRRVAANYCRMIDAYSARGSVGAREALHSA